MNLGDILINIYSIFRFAMKNAVEELKNQANFIISSNDDDGVLQTIELLLSLMEKKEGNTYEN